MGGFGFLLLLYLTGLWDLEFLLPSRIVYRPCPKWRIVYGYASTKVEVFVEKDVREAAPDREGKRALWRNKRVRDFTHFLIHNSTLLSPVLTLARMLVENSTNCILTL